MYLKRTWNTHQPNEDFNIRNEQAKRSINLWLGMYVNAEKHIFEILPHSLFYCRQYRQYIWADLVAWPYYSGCPRKDCGRISKMCFSALAYIPNHRLKLLLACSFCMLKSSFGWCVNSVYIFRWQLVYINFLKKNLQNVS